MHYFYVFCYADDLILTSLTLSRLQHIIDVANKYITEHGSWFNPSKTECTIFVNCNLAPHPQWMLNGATLKESDSVNYLGVTLSHDKPNVRFNNRINACRRVYYALQGAGFNNNISDICCFVLCLEGRIFKVLVDHCLK